MGCARFSSDPTINSGFIKTPDPTDPDSGDFPLGGVLANRYFVKREILGDFLGGHYLGHGLGLQVWGISRWFAEFARIDFITSC